MNTRDKIKEKAFQIANTYEECARILQECTTLNDIKTGFLKAAEVLAGISGTDELVRRLRWYAVPDMNLADFEAIPLRDVMIKQFLTASDFVRKAAESQPE